MDLSQGRNGPRLALRTVKPARVPRVAVFYTYSVRIAARLTFLCCQESWKSLLLRCSVQPWSKHKCLAVVHFCPTVYSYSPARASKRRCRCSLFDEMLQHIKPINRLCHAYIQLVTTLRYVNIMSPCLVVI